MMRGSQGQHSVGLRTQIGHPIVPYSWHASGACSNLILDESTINELFRDTRLAIYDKNAKAHVCRGLVYGAILDYAAFTVDNDRFHLYHRDMTSCDTFIGGYQPVLSNTGNTYLCDHWYFVSIRSQ